MNVSVFGVSQWLAVAGLVASLLAACGEVGPRATGQRAAALQQAQPEGGAPAALVGRWRLGDQVLVFSEAGRLFWHGETGHTRQRYRWDAAAGQLWLGAAQGYYPEREARELAAAYGGAQAFQQALDRSYCVEVGELDRDTAQLYRWHGRERGALVLRRPESSKLESMLAEAVAVRGLDRAAPARVPELRLAPLP